MKARIIITGHARHGKDFVADYWRERFGLRHAGSSRVALATFLLERLNLIREDWGELPYPDIDAAMADRHNHRQLWFEEISAYNAEDPTRLARAVFARCLMDKGRGYCYVGMRSQREIEACREADLVDLVVWVDAGNRVGPEPKGSFDIDPSVADLIIPNQGSIAELKDRLDRIGRFVIGKEKA